MLIKEYNLFKKLFKKKHIETIPDVKEELTLFQALKLPEERMYSRYDKKLISRNLKWPEDRTKRDITQSEYNKLKKKFNIIRKYIEEGKFSFYKNNFNDVSSSYHYDEGLVVVIYNSKQITYPMWTIRGMSDNYYFATLTYLNDRNIEVKDSYLCDTVDGLLQLILDIRAGKTGQIWV